MPRRDPNSRQHMLLPAGQPGVVSMLPGRGHGWAHTAGHPGKTSGLGGQGSPFGGLEWLENLLEKALFSF